MPARFVYWMNVSLDGFIERRAREHGDFDGPDWVRIDEPLHREFNERARALSMLVEGRVVRDLMDPFWPDARSDESLPAYLREFGEIWTAIPKVLVTHAPAQPDHDTRVVGADGDAIEQLAALRRDASGDIGVGGATVATQLLVAGLLDELLLFTHPTLIGAGRPLFDPDLFDGTVSLDLLEQQSYANGVTLHRYAITAVDPA